LNADLAELIADFDPDQLALEAERLYCEGSLIRFLRHAWPYIDPSTFIDGWHLHAIAEHLEAVTRGEIRRLLINIPPRHCKTLLTSVAWPVWTWAQEPDPDNPRIGPGTRFLCASYGAKKAQEDGVTARRLIASDWFQTLWGDRVVIAEDRDNQIQYDTTAGGSRISTGIPESLGRGGVIRLIDDPHKPDDPESELIIDSQIKAYKEVWQTRSNDPSAGAEVIIMQRLGDRDLSGHILDTGDVVHLCLPAEYDPQRHCVTTLPWSDPRSTDAEPIWPERIPSRELRLIRERLGPYAWAGQFQQSPEPRGGGVIKREWWQVWPPPDEEEFWNRTYHDTAGKPLVRTLYPDWHHVLISCDTAYTEKTTNDWTAVTVWGAWSDRRGHPKMMLMGAWRDRLELPDLKIRLLETIRRRKADTILIEAKASGLSVAQELRRLLRDSEARVITIDPKGDKLLRLHAIVPLFTSSLIYAPNTTWAEAVIDEVGRFPHGKHDDFVDSTSMALSWLRRNSIAQLATEYEEAAREALMFRGQVRTIPHEYGVA